MRISVLIATYNRRVTLARSLSALMTQQFPADEYEIVVADDGSADDTPAFLRNLRSPCPLRIIRQENKGQAAARNAALNVASGEVVLFLDDDMLCGPNLVGAHVQAHVSASNILAIGPVLWEQTDNLAAACVQEELQGFYDRLRKGCLNMPRDAWVPPNSSASRQMLLRLGGFDETFVKAREDTDLGLRLWLAGVRSAGIDAARCSHIYVKSVDDLTLRDAEIFGRNDVALARKHPQFRSALPLAHIHSGSALRRYIRSAFGRCIVSPEPLLRPPCWIASRLKSIRPFRNMAIWFIRTRRGIVWIRSAVGEAGSWDELQALTEQVPDVPR